MDTVSALAGALSVPFSSLFSERADTDFDVVRAERMVAVTRTDTFSATLLAQLPASGDLEVYKLRLLAGASRSISSHNFGASEMLYVIRGSMVVETTHATETLEQGDMAVFSANIERVFRAPDGDVDFIMLNRYVDTERIVNMRIQRQARGQY